MSYRNFAGQPWRYCVQPLEEKRICISRTAGTYTFPADFMLVAAMNPCSCGIIPIGIAVMRPAGRGSYLASCPQPLLDRIDICVNVSPVSYEALQAKGRRIHRGDRARVERAHELQKERYGIEGPVLTPSLAQAIRKILRSGKKEKVLRGRF